MLKIRTQATNPRRAADRATPTLAVISGEQLRDVRGGGDIQARAFGAGKYGIEGGG